MRENIYKYISEKGLVYRVCKAFLQLNDKKANNPIKTWVKILKKHFSKEDIQMSQ